MSARAPSYRAVGAEVVLIGNGKPEWARWFRNETRIELPLYCDPRRETYKAAGMTRGLFKVLHPRAALAAFRAFRKGNRQTSAKGDVLQNGGVLILDRAGKPVWRFVQAAAGDLSNGEEILRNLPKQSG